MFLCLNAFLSRRGRTAALVCISLLVEDMYCAQEAMTGILNVGIYNLNVICIKKNSLLASSMKLYRNSRYDYGGTNLRKYWWPS